MKVLLFLLHIAVSCAYGSTSSYVNPLSLQGVELMRKIIELNPTVLNVTKILSEDEISRQLFTFIETNADFSQCTNDLLQLTSQNPVKGK